MAQLMLPLPGSLGTGASSAPPEVHRLEPGGAEAGAGPYRVGHRGHPTAVLPEGRLRRSLLPQHGEGAEGGGVPSSPGARGPGRQSVGGPGEKPSLSEGLCRACLWGQIKDISITSSHWGDFARLRALCPMKRMLQHLVGGGHGRGQTPCGARGGPRMERFSPENGGGSLVWDQRSKLLLGGLGCLPCSPGACCL